MSTTFGETIRSLRIQRGLSQQDLAEKLFVDRSSIASWETGRRVPDATLIARIADSLNVNVAVLMNVANENIASPNVIIVDDEKIVLTGGFPILEKVMPKASIIGFTKPSEALEYARNNRISIAFLDIEMGKTSGITLCKELLQLNSQTNVIFLTAFADYSFDAWKTGASGFILKPLSQEAVREQLSLLRYPIRGEVI